jgi:capsular exopolysaccharide synthesis family protein
MSRVYDALKRAEQQRGERQPGNGAVPATAEPIKAPEAVVRASETIALASQSAPLPLASERTERVTKRRISETSGEPIVTNGNSLLVVGKEQYSAAAEQFHLLSLSLRNWTTEHGERIFAIASALSGEGKSFVALNLAASLATLGNRVVLIDADLRVPVMHRAFGLGPAKGLADYLTEAADFSECIHSTQIDNLLLVPAGHASNAPVEMLAGSRMNDFIAELRAITPEHYVIIDTPAATVVPEQRILGRLADAFVLVVAANRTPRQLIKRTIENAAEAKICGIVLNHFQAPYSTVSYYPERYKQSRNQAPAMRS